MYVGDDKDIISLTHRYSCTMHYYYIIQIVLRVSVKKIIF